MTSFAKRRVEAGKIKVHKIGTTIALIAGAKKSAWHNLYSKKIIKHHHNDKAKDHAECRFPVISPGMGFGDNFLTDHKERRSSNKCQRTGQIFWENQIHFGKARIYSFNVEASDIFL